MIERKHARELTIEARGQELPVNLYQVKVRDFGFGKHRMLVAISLLSMVVSNRVS